MNALWVVSVFSQNNTLHVVNLITPHSGSPLIHWIHNNNNNIIIRTDYICSTFLMLPSWYRIVPGWKLQMLNDRNTDNLFILFWSKTSSGFVSDAFHPILSLKRRFPSTKALRSSLRKNAIRWCEPSNGWMRWWKERRTSPHWRRWTSTTVTSACTEVNTMNEFCPLPILFCALQTESCVSLSPNTCLKDSRCELVSWS